MKDWKKNLIVVWIAQFFAMVGMSAIVPFLPLFIRDLGVSSIDETARWSGLIFAGPFVLSFFLTPVWGSLGDKYGRKLMTLRAIFGLAFAQFLIGFAQTPLQLFLIRLVQGALSGFLPAAMALIASNTPKEKTGYALGMLQSSTAAGNVLGPFLGGFLADIFGYREVFFLVSGLLFLTGFFIVFFVKEGVKVDPESYNFTWRGNWLYLLKSRFLRNVAILIALTSFGLSFIRPIFVLYLETFTIKSDYFATITGAIYGIVGIFTVFSATWWGKRSEITGFKKNLIYASLLTGIMYTLHAFVFNAFFLIPIRALLGFAYGGLAPLLFTLISNGVPQERKGGILGVATSFQILGNMLAPIFSGMVSASLGFRIPFIFSGIIFIIMMIISMIEVKN